MWLELVIGKAHVIDVERGGICTILADEDKWDWLEVERSILPQFQLIIDHLERYRKEIYAALNKRKSAVVP